MKSKLKFTPAAPLVMSKVDWWLISLLLLICAVVLNFSWIGWLDSDDKLMFRGAIGWLANHPYVGQDHHQVRHLVTLPMALSMNILGINETSVIVPTILYFLGILLCTYFGVRYIADRSAAFLATGFLISLPLFATRATIADADITMLFFLVASIWLFIIAISKQNRTGYLFISGMMVGCAWITKETTVALIVFYGILFFLGYCIHRRQYWIVAGGFLLIVGLEAAYMYFTTGQPLYRYILSLYAVDVWHAAAAGNATLDDIGNLRFHKAVDHILILLVNNDFVLLFYLFVPAAWWFIKSNFRDKVGWGVSLLFVGLAVVWHIAIVLMLSKFLHPRYFSLTAYLAVIVLALWIRYEVWSRSKGVAILIVALFLMSNLMSIYVGNRDPLFGERALREFIAQSDEVVYTDPVSHRRAKFLLEIQGVSDMVRSEEMLPVGVLFFHNPNRAEYPFDKLVEQKTPRKWTVVWSKQDNRKFIGVVIEALGINNYLPVDILRRLNRPNKAVSIYRADLDNSVNSQKGAHDGSS